MSLSEVASHDSLTDAWIVIENVVYDISEYIAAHPGMDIITEYIGQDATAAFDRVAHSAVAKRVLTQDVRIQAVGILSGGL